MKDIKKILVTGCGGDIGQSIGKILKMEYNKSKIIGCDIHDKHAGNFIFDKCFLVPRADSKNYKNSIKKIVKKNKPDLIIPTSEAELRYFYDNKITEISEVPLITANFKSMKIGDNKLLTQRFLKENNLPYAWTKKANEKKPKEFPCILKDISSRGGKGLKVIEEKDYEKYKDLDEKYIFQELLKPDDKEYTCGLFRSKKGDIRSIIFHRSLMSGYTNYGEVVLNKNISKLLKKIAEKLDLIGSINIQLKLTKNKGPVVFEINPRFSSTVLFRHMLGFKDVIWSINDYFQNPIGLYKPLGEGTKIYKGWQEYILYKDKKKATIDNIDFNIKKT